MTCKCSHSSTDETKCGEIEVRDGLVYLHNSMSVSKYDGTEIYTKLMELEVHRLVKTTWFQDEYQEKKIKDENISFQILGSPTTLNTGSILIPVRVTVKVSNE